MPANEDVQAKEGDQAMDNEPHKEHQWLQQLVGEWTTEIECVMEPDQPPAKTKGTETVRSLGGLWVVCEGQGEMPGGGPTSVVLTLGYDPQRKRFVGTFIASMMSHLWTYDGELDPTGKSLTLNAEGPSMTAAGTASYKDVIEIVSDRHRRLKSHILGDDGTWLQFMTADYRRVR
jgi:hypothetical protein